MVLDRKKIKRVGHREGGPFFVGITAAKQTRTLAWLRICFAATMPKEKRDSSLVCDTYSEVFLKDLKLNERRYNDDIDTIVLLYAQYILKKEL